MMNRITSILVLLTLLGCSNKSGDKAETPPATQAQTAPAAPEAPNEFTLAESPEAREENEIKAQAKKLFGAKNYEALDALAKLHRDSKATFPDGSLKLRKVYAGISLKQESPEASFEAHLSQLHDWISARPGSITARLALADALVTYAWKARGSGYANTVTDDGWKLMGARLGEAAQVLKDSGSLSEDCPFRWSMIFSVGLGLQMEKPQYEAIFEKAIASEPSCATSYYCAMAYYLMPRWNGAPGEMRDFMQKSADKIGGEDGDVLYARMAWSLTFRVSGDIFDDEKVSWERADRGFQIIEKRFPDSTRIKCQRLYVALMGSKNVEVPRQMVAELHGKIDPVIWESKEDFIWMTKSLYPEQTAKR
jgi:hypothetical protein